MANQNFFTVIDSTGRRGTVADNALGSMPSGSQVLIRFESMQPITVPVDLLVLRADGDYDLPLNVAELTTKPSQDGTNQTIVLPVMEEEVVIGKREVETGTVRIKKVVQEKQELVDVPLVHEAIEIKHVPINRPVASPIAVRQEGDTLIISLLEEVLVVQKQLVLKEEIHITTKRTEHHQPEAVTLRREAVIVEPDEAAITSVQP